MCPILSYQNIATLHDARLGLGMHLPKRWECPTIFGRKFLEIYVVRR